MLVYASRLLDAPVISLQSGHPIGFVSKIIVNPDNLRVIAMQLSGGVTHKDLNILDISSIREYSAYGIIVDSADDLAAPDDIIKIADVLKLNFDLIGLKAKTKKGSKLGKVIDYTIFINDFIVQQIIVKRPTIKSFIDPELIIPTQEIIEVNDYEIIIKEEEKTIKEKATKEEFVPNFINPFREPGFAPTDNQSLADKDTE